MEYSLNTGEWNKVFAVPSSVVDKYIKLASGNALKLLLYLMRHGGESFTAEILRAELGFEELGELEDAALFWVQRGIINASSGKNSIKLTSANPEKVSESAPAESTPAVTAKQTVQKVKPPAASGGEIAEQIKNSPEMKALFEAAEKLFGRMLRASDREAISNLTGYYGLPCDVALMLIGYCTNLKEKHGKSISANYISKVAQNWSDEEVMTVQLADEKIRSLEKQSGIEESIRQKMGLSSNLSANMRNYIKIWAVDWGFSEDMIMLAYDKTVDSTGEWNSSYANKILGSWKSAGITTPQQAEKSDEEFRKANSFKKPSAPAKRPVTTAAANKSSIDIDRLMAQVKNNYKK